MTHTRCTEVDLSWQPSPLARVLAACAAAALAAAVMGNRWQLIVFAAPLLGVLCSMRWQPPPPKIHIHTQPNLLRCFETEHVTFSVWATTEAGEAALDLTVVPVAGMRLDMLDEAGRHEQAFDAVADRWGRYPIAARVDAVAAGGLLAATATIDTASIYVFPIPPAQSTPIPPADLLDRLGTHLTRHIGTGVEYAGIRAYVPGDQLRTVNWPVSARRGSLHVTQRLSERAADVVVLIDTHPQPPGPATEATQRTVSGAVQVVQSALRNGDRAGIVTLGGRPRWLGADIGRRQFYRVLDAALGAGDDTPTATGTLAPRAALPTGAIVVAFSTLLDTEFALALIDLSRRGHVVVAIDVLQDAPFEAEPDPLVARMWALQRSFMYRDMRTIGVDIVPWLSDSTLDQAMHLVPESRRRPPGRR